MQVTKSCKNCLNVILQAAKHSGDQYLKIWANKNLAILVKKFFWCKKVADLIPLYLDQAAILTVVSNVVSNF